MRQLSITEFTRPYKWNHLIEKYRKERRYFYLQREKVKWSRNFSAPLMPSKLLLYCDIVGEHLLNRNNQSYLGHPDFLALRRIEDGNELVRYDGKVYLMEAGDFMLFLPFLDFEYATGPAGQCLVRSITMKGRILESLLEQANLRNFSFFRPTDSNFFTKAFSDLKKMFQMRENYDPARNAGIAFQLIQHLFDLASRQEEPAELAEIRHYIDSNPDRDLSLAALSRKFNRSSTYLNSLFRKHLQTSVHSYTEASRMRSAMEMLQWMNVSVKETAAALGFSSQFNFSTRFRRYWGCPPSAMQPRKG